MHNHSIAIDEPEMSEIALALREVSKILYLRKVNKYLQIRRRRR